MKKILYLTTWDFSNAEANGICKKILAQVAAFKKMGFKVDFGYTVQGRVFIERDRKKLEIGRAPSAINVFMAPLFFANYVKRKKYDAAYIRYSPSNYHYMKMLINVRKSCNKVVLEVPTYPYDAELKLNYKLRIGLFIDKLHRKKMKKYVDRAVVYTKVKDVFGIPAIETINGVDFRTIPERKNFQYGKDIQLIAVAMLSPWHGYDRVIQGMGEYYQQNPKKKIIFHVVGDGVELERYKKMAEQYGITQYVMFYGNKAGNELNDIYEKADIAVSTIGLHRIELNNASPLKTREYGARGLPMIATNKIEFFPKDFQYTLVIPSDESAVDMNQVVSFYEELKGLNRQELAENIREFTRLHADIPTTLAPICEFLNA